MNNTSNHPDPLQTMEEGVHVLFSNAKEGFCHCYQDCEDHIRKSPVTAVLGAVAAGYLLHRMPVRAILVTQVRILSALTPPALVLFGAAKIYDFMRSRKRDEQP